LLISGMPTLFFAVWTGTDSFGWWFCFSNSTSTTSTGVGYRMRFATARGCRQAVGVRTTLRPKSSLYVPCLDIVLPHWHMSRQLISCVGNPICGSRGVSTPAQK
jgi:hypothetical protein